ncbi:SCO family protein [Candidatus Thioglobus sp.]|uniref:SCO family protein n=1 Tax=Candidatus Thioglobus sp. TaxID=2026721 RepID=UPI00262D8866|nr:SCO family protein [Candidatus Thioglobus sp.]MDG2394964.1 SCO family protein [Candidatus Thioglobus sp.]
MKQKHLILILIITSLIFLSYYAAQPNIKNLKEQVSPTVSVYPSPKTLNGNLSLIDDNNKSVSLSTIANNKWSILYFGYTSCPDVCPIDLAILNQTVGKMNQAEKLQVVFISVDPDRDVGKLTKFVGRFNADFVGLSAKDEDLRKLTKALGVYHEIAQIKQRSSHDHANHAPKADHTKMTMHMEGHANHAPKSDYLIDHTASYLLLNPNLELVGLLTNPHNAKKMAPALDLILETLD